jgi:uncharacterized membrane-anchored protein
MSKTQDARRKPKPRIEKPPVDALTVGWMMTMITTLICLIAAAAARAFVRYVNAEAVLVGALSGLLLFSAAVIGLILLVMTPIVVKRKNSDPPTGLVFFAYLVGIAPLAGMLLQAWE